MKTPDEMARELYSAGKVEKSMREFKEGTLHSGSKTGPKVTDRRQALAIGLSEARKEGEDVPQKSSADSMPKKRPHPHELAKSLYAAKKKDVAEISCM